MSSTALTIIPHKIQKKKNSLKSTDELTPKQKLFAEIYVANFGKITKQEAYEKAGFKVTSAGPSKLTNPNLNPHVCRYIEKLRTKELNKYADKLRHLKTYDYLQEKAVEKGQIGHAVNAEFRKGQAMGFYIDRKEIKTSSLEGMTRDDLEKRLAELESKISSNAPIMQRTQKDERLKLFEGSGTRDVGTWSPVMELPFPLPASRHSSPVPASRSVFPFVEIFDFIKDKHRL
jgi:phage terminase small subunit